MSKKLSDVELVNKVKRGDQRAFEEILSRYSGKVFSLASRLTRNPEDAEEVLQDVFTTVHRKLKNFEGKSTFSSWLYRVTVNASFMKLRKRRQLRSVAFEDVAGEIEDSLLARTGDDQSAESIALRNQLIQVLQSAISSLPEDFRAVFVLRDIDGLSSKEVSKVLQITVPAVKSRLHRSRSLVRRRVSRHIGGHEAELATAVGE